MPDPTTISTHLQARRAGTLLAADIATAKVFSPQLGALIAGIKPHAGSSRSSMTVPIAPEPEPRDTMGLGWLLKMPEMGGRCGAH